MSGGRHIHIVRASFELVTPAFCGGASPAGRPEIRLPHLLGALRFWWRALAWSRTRALEDVESAADIERARLAQLKRWEGALFGSADTGQGRFIARLDVDQPTVEFRRIERGQPGGYGLQELGSSEFATGSGVSYLAGQGLGKRQCIAASARFMVTFRWRDGLGGQSSPSLLDAVRLFGLVGGIGARTRRGFGSVVLENLEIDDQVETLPRTQAEYIASLSRLLPGLAGATGDAAAVPYSALSEHTHVAYVPGDSRGIGALHDEMGHRLQFYRSYGQRRGGQRYAGGVEVESPNFEVDHDWFCDVVQHIRSPAAPDGLRTRGPDRAVFGLPHNYFRYGGRNGIDYRVKLSDPLTDRRASPLFLHLHPVEEGALAIWMLLPARFTESEQTATVALSIAREQLDPPARRQSGPPKAPVQGRQQEKKIPRKHEPVWTVQAPISYAPIIRFLDPDQGHLPRATLIRLASSS